MLSKDFISVVSSLTLEDMGGDTEVAQLVLKRVQDIDMSSGIDVGLYDTYLI